MKIIVASENREKFEGVKGLFPKAEIVTIDASPYIGDVAFDRNIFIGAVNRIRLGALKDFNYGEKDWDLIVALQSGYVRNGDNYYITDVCAVLDKNGLRVGNGPMFEISRVLYEAEGKGIRLDKLVDGQPNSSKATTVLEYMSEGVLNRPQATYLALNNALNSDYVDFGKMGFDYGSKIKFTNKNTKFLNNKCCEIREELKTYNDRENWLPEA